MPSEFSLYVLSLPCKVYVSMTPECRHGNSITVSLKLLDP